MKPRRTSYLNFVSGSGSYCPPKCAQTVSFFEIHCVKWYEKKTSVQRVQPRHEFRAGIERPVAEHCQQHTYKYMKYYAIVTIGFRPSGKTMDCLDQRLLRLCNTILVWQSL